MADTSCYGRRAPARAGGPEGAGARARACASRRRAPSVRTARAARTDGARRPRPQITSQKTSLQTIIGTGGREAYTLSGTASVASTIFSALALKIGVFPQEKRYFFFIFYKISKKFYKK